MKNFMKILITADLLHTLYNTVFLQTLSMVFSCKIPQNIYYETNRSTATYSLFCLILHANIVEFSHMAHGHEIVLF